MFTCLVCGATESKSQLVNKVLRIDGKYVRVDHIPANVCARCGEETLSRETTEKVRLLIQGQAKPTRSTTLDIFEFEHPVGRISEA